MENGYVGNVGCDIQVSMMSTASAVTAAERVPKRENTRTSARAIAFRGGIPMSLGAKSSKTKKLVKPPVTKSTTATA